MAQDMTAGHIPATTEPFDLTAFLTGRTRAWGIFEDRFGRVRRRLRVDMNGRWEGGVFILDEEFEYDCLVKEVRTWRIEPTGTGQFRARCADCVGDARGQSGPGNVRMSYRFRLKMEAIELVVTFDDRVYRMSDTMAVNRATMSKWGIKLGELSLFFQKIDQGALGATAVS